MALDMPTLINTFETSLATGEGIGSDFKQKIIIESGALTVPIGAIVPWLKSFIGVPTLATQGFNAMFVECNGQVLNDSDSLLNGQTIPNLNGSAGTKRFLRGSTTSGTTGGSESHDHSYGDDTAGGNLPNRAWRRDTNSSSTSTLPSYYEVVFIMRVK